MRRHHYSDVIMSAMASQITGVIGLCEGNSSAIDEFPAQMASNAENASIWWRHHDDISVSAKMEISTSPCKLRELACAQILITHIVVSLEIMVPRAVHFSYPDFMCCGASAIIWLSYSVKIGVSTLKLGENGRHISGDILDCIFKWMLLHYDSGFK